MTDVAKSDVCKVQVKVENVEVKLEHTGVKLEHAITVPMSFSVYTVHVSGVMRTC